MLHHPEVMKKAQAEIDLVVGPSRMPEFEDMESLPYVNAIMKEVARYVPTSCSAQNDPRMSIPGGDRSLVQASRTS